jgi:hypothetical protein
MGTRVFATNPVEFVALLCLVPVFLAPDEWGDRSELRLARAKMSGGVCGARGDAADLCDPACST